MRDRDPARDFALFALRFVVGAALFYYGCQKFLGWFGGMGFQGTVNLMSTKMGIPVPFAVLAIIAEFFGGLGILVGLLTRMAAFGAACTMAVATFINIRNMTSWVPVKPGDNPIQSVAYPAAFLAISIALMVMGAGSWSLDRYVAARRKR